MENATNRDRPPSFNGRLMSAVEWPHVVRRALFPFLSQSSARQAAFGVTLAVLISYSACLVLGFGLVGSKGSSVVTGALLFGLPLLLFLFSFRRWPPLQLSDFLFAGLLIAALLSSLINPRDNQPGSTKEYLLLVTSLAGYLACRSMLVEDVAITRSAFERITAVIVLLGAVFTAAEIFNQWDDPRGKPFVLGFPEAITNFTMSLGFLIIALVTVDEPRPRRTAIIAILIFLPAAIFAAAMVRFVFVALAGSLFVAMILAERGKRWHTAIVGFALFLAVVVGLSARYDTAKTYAALAVEQTAETSAVKTNASGTTTMPSCKLAVNLDNTIAIRQALAKDAIYLIRTAGFLGTGLDSFMNLSCIKAHEVHVSVLQAAVEFGWIGGIFWLLLMGSAIYRIAPLAKRSGSARFILCSLTFAILLSLAHGRISRDNTLFALLGAAVGVTTPSARSKSSIPS
jgi:O-antigen ligase